MIKDEECKLKRDKRRGIQQVKIEKAIKIVKGNNNS